MASDTSTALTHDLTAYLDWYFEQHPVPADALGVPGHSSRLGDFTAAAFEGRERDRSGWLARFEAERAATPADRIDRDLVIAMLRGQALADRWPSWRRDPSAYLGPIFTGLFTPFLHRLLPEPELVAASEARLAEVPAVLAACRANLDPGLAAPLLVRRALGQAKAGPDFLTTALPAQVHDDALRARIADATGPAVRAFETTVTFLTQLAERATGDWRMGETLYTALLQQRELLGYGAAELRGRGQVAWDRLDGEMRELAVRVPGGSTDWRATMASLQADHPPTLEAMRSEYEAETSRARAFLAEHELVTFADGEQCRVVPAPPYQRPLLAVASYLQPPGLTASRTGHFFVPYTPDGASDEAIEARLRTNARAQLPTISVHETYPGHHWHLSWTAGRCPAVRAVHSSSYFVEGWALYVEGMMREQGYFADPAHELAHLDARILRAARIVVDTALHCGDMEPAEAEEFMVTKASLTPEAAAGEVDRYCAWPTQAPSYLTGCLEIEQLRAEWTAAGRGGLREFHDTLAATGCLPLGLARAATIGS
ncbi:MAG: DUF885 family protein [Pseudonocardiaceae bacterium]|nr:DUF885 family protein [Pseudonocardiaceae bacterium]